jgi:transposase-like protein
MAKKDVSHSGKMCDLTCCPCNLDLDKIRPLVRDAKFICKSCGRVAADKGHLCQPVKL